MVSMNPGGPGSGMRARITRRTWRFRESMSLCELASARQSKQLQGKGNITFALNWEADPLGMRDNMMRAYLASGDEPPGYARPDRNVEQAVAVQVTEFASVLLDEFNPAESVNFQTNIEQT